MNKSKNILYIGGFELPDKNAAAQRVVTNGKLLSKIGYNVYFAGINRERNDSKPFYQINNGLENCWDIKYPSSNLEWISYLSSTKWIKGLLESEFNNNIYSLIVYNYPAVALLKLHRFCKKNNIKLIADCTEWYQVTGSIIFRIIKGFDTFFRMRIVHNKIDGVIVISKYLFNFYNNRAKTVVLIPPLIDKENPKWNISDYKPNKIKHLIYAGSPGNGNKDKLDIILEALSIVKIERKTKFILRIVGITQDQFILNFGRKSIPENIKSDLQFMGRLSHEDTIKYIQNADFSIFVREKNLATLAGFPTKFVESISCGTPVLTNASSNIEDYLVQGENGFLLDLNNFNKLTESLGNSISQAEEKMDLMKKICKNSDLFDYNNYLSEFEVFLSR